MVHEIKGFQCRASKPSLKPSLASFSSCYGSADWHENTAIHTASLVMTPNLATGADCSITADMATTTKITQPEAALSENEEPDDSQRPGDEKTSWSGQVLAITAVHSGNNLSSGEPASTERSAHFPGATWLEQLWRRHMDHEEQWSIHWYLPSSMVAFYVAGACTALGHHVYYSSYHGTIVQSAEWPMRFGTALAFLSKAGFAAAVQVAYKQCAWVRTFR